MSKIKELQQTDVFIVAISVQGESEIRVFKNRSEEYVIARGYKKVKTCESSQEAEKAIYDYKNRNTCYMIVDTSDGLEIIREEISKMPKGTLAICRDKEQVYKECGRLENHTIIGKTEVA